MDVDLHKTVAGVDYLVSVQPRVRILPRDALLAEFIGTQPPDSDGIRVDLVAGELPDVRAWPILLSSGPAWSIRQRGAKHCLILGEPAASPPTGLVACWDGDACRATVYCGAEYFTAGPGCVETHYSVGYPVDQLLLIYHLARRHGLLVHAAGLEADGRTLLFPGASGAGKSTLARQFLAEDWSRLLSDDRIIVRWLDDAWQAFGTPWPGDAGVAVNAGAPLAGILFPTRGGDNRIRELTPQSALERLLPATSMLWHEEELLSGQLETCERLLSEIPAFELCWSPDAGVVDDVREFVRRL